MIKQSSVNFLFPVSACAPDVIFLQLGWILKSVQELNKPQERGKEGIANHKMISSMIPGTVNNNR